MCLLSLKMQRKITLVLRVVCTIEGFMISLSGHVSCPGHMTERWNEHKGFKY